MQAPRAPLARGPRSVACALSCACLALIAALFLREALFGPRVLCQADALLAFEPWSSVAPEGHRPANPLLLDQSLVVLPWLDFAAERVRAGELPLWNPYNYCGQPIAAAATGAFWHPLSWAYFAAPSLAHYERAAFVRLLLAGLFTWLFLRRLQLGAPAALLGAICFMLSGFLVAWLNHPHANVAILLPALLWLTERAAQREQRASSVAWIALASALALLGGHLQTALHVLLASQVYALARARGPQDALVQGGARARLRLGALHASGLALGALLAAPQLLPMAEYLGHSRARELFAALEVTSPVPLAAALRMLVQPHAFGAPHTHDYAGPLGDNLNYSELVGGYASVTALVLAGCAAVCAWRESRVRRFALGALLALLVAWQCEPLYSLAHALPVLGSTKLLRLLLLVAFAIAVLAAIGLEALSARLRLAPATRAMLAALACALATAELFAAGRGFNPAIEPELVAPATPLTDFLAAQPQPYRALAVDNTILLPQANLFHRVPLVSGYDSVEDRRMVELVALLSRAPAAGLEHYAPAGLGAREALFIKEIRSFDRLEALPLASLLGVEYLIARHELPAPLELVHESSLRVYANPHALPRVFAARDWIELEGAAALERLGAPDFDPRLALLEAGAHERGEHARAAHAAHAARAASASAAPSREVELESCEPRALHARTRFEQPGLLVVAHSFDPGWKARVNGERVPLERVDHALSGLFVPAGEARVELEYAPDSLRLGFALAAAGALACAALLALAARRSFAPRAARA